MSCVDTKSCDYISENLDEKDERSVLLQAIPMDFPYKYVFFNATLLREDWRMFKVRVYRNQDPTVSICRKYTRKDYSNVVYRFQIELPERDSYAKFVGKQVNFDYEIHSHRWSGYGRIKFLVPSYSGLVFFLNILFKVSIDSGTMFLLFQINSTNFERPRAVQLCRLHRQR